ncbi:hypothetical protein [Brachyspira sp.]|uniref:hypothetical protein n=1 Tax=Brachyspira sp. TaxID=1977261 RepID=UPI00260B0BA9|nr:hypothetical protein [Brachyspira sp.]
MKKIKNILFILVFSLIMLSIFSCSSSQNPNDGPSGLAGTTWSSEYAGEGSGYWAALYFEDNGKVSIGWCVSEKSAIKYAQGGGRNGTKGDYTFDGKSGNIKSSKEYARGNFTVNGNTLTFQSGMKPTYNKK